MEYFVHECPVCGRPLRILTIHARRQVTCGHCRGHFVAVASSVNGNSLVTQENRLLRRADQLLEMVAQRLGASEARKPARFVSSTQVTSRSGRAARGLPDVNDSEKRSSVAVHY